MLASSGKDLEVLMAAPSTLPLRFKSLIVVVVFSSTKERV
jgi:hypothetical protein